MDSTGIQQTILQFAPSMLIQIVMAIVFFRLFRKLGKNPWPLTLLTVVPLLGLFVAAFLPVYFMHLLTDRLVAIEAANREAVFR